jgi:ribosomal protein S27E
MQLSDIEEKLDSGTPIKCPHCRDENTVKIYQDGYSYQYRCNECLKISLIDIVFSVVNVNGIDGEIEFVGSPQETDSWRNEGKMIIEPTGGKSWIEAAYTGSKINSSAVFIDGYDPTQTRS